MAMDTKARRIFSVCGNRVMVVSDPDKGTVVATAPIGAGSDGVIFDPGTGYAISANGDGTMTIVQQTGGKYEVVENVATERAARTIALDEKTHRVYTPTAAYGTAPAGGRAQQLPDSFKVLVVGK
jgi:DNA-binding beta-propeller fold protein YncE